MYEFVCLFVCLSTCCLFWGLINLTVVLRYSSALLFNHFRLRQILFYAQSNRRLHRQLHARGLPSDGSRLRRELGAPVGSDEKGGQVEGGENGKIREPLHGQ